MQTLRQLFDAHRGRLLGKIDHFFDDYEPHLQGWRGRSPRLLELGVHGGGSLELWQNYFGAGADIHGVDIDPATAANCPPGARVHIGSQDDADFLGELVRQHGPFDIVIDDGSHRMDHQISSFEILYSGISEQGIYICEDAFTSYWPIYGGGAARGDTFIDYARNKVDELHAWWVEDGSLIASELTANTRFVTFLSGAVIFQRGKRQPPVYAIRRGEDFSELSASQLHTAARRNLGEE